jgi:hypothetical protein
LERFREARVCDCGQHGFVGLTLGACALYSPEDHEKVAGRLWHAVSRARRQYAVSGRDYMHRVVASFDGMVDHRNFVGIDNRRENLRQTDHSKNGANCRAKAGSICGFKGVRRVGRRFYARLRVHGETINAGGFPTAFEAALKYDQIAVQYFGDRAATNASLGLLEGGPK